MKSLQHSDSMFLEAKNDAPPAQAIRVFLVDDNAVIRAGLRVLIDSWLPFQVVGEADTAAEAVAALGKAQPNLIVCSHTGPANGIAGIRDLTKGAAYIPVVLLTGSRNPQVDTLAVQAGARWIIGTKEPAMDFRKALEKVHSGEYWLDEVAPVRRSAEKNRKNSQSQGASVIQHRLTSRERDVAALVTQGCTNRQVGERLGITEVTVRHHLTSIFNKLRITNRFQLIARRYRTGVTNSAALR
jgi:DNA-binding NarL/FixJ family response regulator